MADKNVGATLKLRRDTTTNWSTANPVLAIGELGLDTTAKLIKIGDGVTTWNTLLYHKHPSLTLNGNVYDGSAAVSLSIAIATDTIWDVAGDLAVGSGANTAVRLPIGEAGQILKVNDLVTGLEWKTPINTEPNLVPNSWINTTSADYGFGTRTITGMTNSTEYTFTISGNRVGAAATLKCIVYASDWSWSVALEITSTTEVVLSTYFTTPADIESKTVLAKAYSFPEANGDTVYLRWMKISQGILANGWTFLGATAYQQAVIGGYTGTAGDFYADLAAVEGFAAELAGI